MAEQTGKNNFTHVSHRSRSVVDYMYVLVPHEQLSDVKSLNIYLMTEIIEHFKLNGFEKIPDHSILLWESEILPATNDKGGENPFSQRKTFNVSSIPTEFFNSRDAANLIQRTVERIDRSLSEEHGANDAYSAFMDLIYSEMNAKLKCLL